MGGAVAPGTVDSLAKTTINAALLTARFFEHRGAEAQRSDSFGGFIHSSQRSDERMRQTNKPPSGLCVSASLCKKIPSSLREGL
jgi:hypothetical protein